MIHPGRVQKRYLKNFDKNDGNEQDGSLVKWDVGTGDTTVVVAQETMSRVSKTATFISFSPNNTDLVTTKFKSRANFIKSMYVIYKLFEWVPFL